MKKKKERKNKRRMEDKLLPWATFVSKASTSLFASSCLYVSMIEHPARLNMNVKDALQQFQLTFPRVATLQSTFALLATGSGLLHYYYMKDSKMLTAVLLVASAVPYTFIALMPTNRLLLDNENASKDLVKSRSLLEKWGKLHLYRTVVGLVAMVDLLYHF